MIRLLHALALVAHLCHLHPETLPDAEMFIEHHLYRRGHRHVARVA